MSGRRALLAAGVTALSWLSCIPAQAAQTAQVAQVAQAPGTAGAPGRAGAPRSPSYSSQGSRRAPSSSPLATGPGGGAEGGAEAEAADASPSSGGEPLAGNGLDSPLCRNRGAAELSASAARDCRATGFEAAQAPGGDYAFDVHINTGVTELPNYAATMFQDIAQFVWTSLVAVVHGLIVLLDWCFTLDLLDGPAMSGVGRELRATQATFTQPWLATVLAIAAVLAAYNGLVRRRVADTLGEALLMAAMMAGGLWVIMDPTGTVGVLGAWANEASLGTLGAVTAGTPSHPERTLAENNEHMFSAAIGGPWCYLEFGDVNWCESPARLDPRLRAAALKIAAAHGGQAPAASSTLLRAARTNGALFLALPANGPARNSINEEWSLYRALCGGGEEPCTGPTASQAEFRTQSGTIARIVGMGFISFGLFGMILVLGFLALRLLYAAIVSLICLLLTPAAVLAPALGESGRAVFRVWALRLLGSVTSKLLFSFLLGVVLETEQTLASVQVGWWTQWVLVSAMWWIGYANRHKALDFAYGERAGRRDSVARRARAALGATREVSENLGWARRKLARRAPSVEQRRRRERAAGERARTIADEQVGRSLEHELQAARELVGAGPDIQADLTGLRQQQERVRAQRELASTAGDTRRALKLGARAGRIEGEIARREEMLEQARRTVADGEHAQRGTGASHTRAQREARARWLDAQAALPAAGRTGAYGERRDYAALAGLAGHDRARYEQLDDSGKRAARLEIDRELASRRELGGAVADVAAAGVPGRGERPSRKADAELERALGERLRAEGRRPPGSHDRGNPGGAARFEQWQREGAARARTHARAPAHRSTVLDDAREVAARRKRQLGRGRS